MMQVKPRKVSAVPRGVHEKRDRENLKMELAEEGGFTLPRWAMRAPVSAGSAAGSAAGSEGRASIWALKRSELPHSGVHGLGIPFF